MNCPKCGQENKQDAAFCMACGAPLPDVPFAQLDGKRSQIREEGVSPKAAPSAPGMEPAAPRPAVPRDARGVEKGRSVVEEIRGMEEAAEGATKPTVSMQAVPPAGSTGAAAVAGGPSTAGQPTAAGRHETMEAQEAKPPRQEMPAPTAMPQPSGHPQYYVPPEADHVVAAWEKADVYPPETGPVTAEKTTPVAPAGYVDADKTQAISPATPVPPPRPARRPTVTCPECYAPNPEGNSFCQECGSPLFPVGARASASVRPAPPREGRQQTAVLPSAAMAEAAPRGAYADKAARAAGSGKGFGVADALALVAVAAAGAALALSSFMESFSWKKGLDMGMFAHQGAFTQGRADLLGGPGILPYHGVEFLTVGLVAAVGMALALAFLAARVGRGPMFILAGCLLLFPLFYLVFQALLPLRQTGIEIQPSLGIGALISGGADSPGLGPPLWMISGAGAIMILAGFIAPPRGWGRLFTFLALFPAMAGLAFFCAACYNWNLFISAAGLPEVPAGYTAIAAPAAARVAGMLPLLP